MKVERYKCDSCEEFLEDDQVVKIRITLEKESNTSGGSPGEYYTRDYCVVCMASLLNDRHRLVKYFDNNKTAVIIN